MSCPIVAELYRWQDAFPNGLTYSRYEMPQWGCATSLLILNACTQPALHVGTYLFTLSAKHLSYFQGNGQGTGRISSSDAVDLSALSNHSYAYPLYV